MTAKYWSGPISPLFLLARVLEFSQNDFPVNQPQLHNSLFELSQAKGRCTGSKKGVCNPKSCPFYDREKPDGKETERREGAIPSETGPVPCS